MIHKLKNHLDQNLSFLKDKKLLLAVSGGIDSMVLVHLLKQLNYGIAIAHCNFSLRGDESNGDEKFLTEYALGNDIELHVITFDTASFAADNKLSIQVAARQLRYMWFYELLQNKNLDYLLTAHHLDDSIETFLINFTRGTGIEGLTGIPQQNDKIIRPLLPFTREEIEAYAKENNIRWREDSTNASDKYLRNKLRHEVLPILKALNPSFADSFIQTVSHLQQAQSLVEDASVLIYKQVVTEKELQKHISLTELLRLSNYTAYLYQWLSPFGFTAWDDIYALTVAQSGKQVLSPRYRLIKHREMLILEPLPAATVKEFLIPESATELFEPFHIKITAVDEIDKAVGDNTIYVDAQKLKYPLTVRKWQEGDYLYPVGMKGQKKKISKYFKDEKMSLSEKESVWLLCSESQILWVISKRADERFKTDKTTTKILKIEVL
jgi:tRNA(Ile)-lysidine synthase